MNITIVVLISIIICSCSGQKNLMIGVWEFNGDVTLTELRAGDVAPPESVVNCYLKKACGYDVVFTYSDTTWRQYFTFNRNSETDPMAYEYERISENVYLINTPSGGEYQEYTVHFISDSEAYIPVTIKDFTYKEYLRKKR